MPGATAALAPSLCRPSEQLLRAPVQPAPVSSPPLPTQTWVLVTWHLALGDPRGGGEQSLFPTTTSSVFTTSSSWITQNHSRQSCKLASNWKNFTPQFLRGAGTARPVPWRGVGSRLGKSHRSSTRPHCQNSFKY